MNNTVKENNITFFVILGIVTILFLYLLQPFFFPIFWAAVIAGVFRPLYSRINGKLNRPNLSTAILFLLIALIILLPAGTVGTLVFNESVQMYEKLSPDTKHMDRSIQRLINTIADNSIARLFHVNKTMLIAKTTEVAQGITSYIFVHLTELTQNTLGLLVKFAIMLYTLFFFVRDGERFLGMAMKVLPLGMGREKFLYERFIVTARSTLKVTLIIGGIQGVLGGVVFLVTDVEGALIWGLLMILMAIVPLVGCSIIWAPAGILMLLTGHIWEGVLILAVGFLVISTVDNLLRPILIGKDVAMHPLLIFLSTLGGIILFGFSGFVIGPVITSLLIAIWEMYEEFYRRDKVSD
ncbi:MAG: AI-2E family transporter [Deltaproteobacteria bacterium]|nr:MAG: AI-2E family transporter [Deltaproteobacteria bacterium]